MSIIGSALGIGLGIGLAVLVKEGLNRFNFGLPEGPLVLTPSAAIIGAVVGVSVTVLSSLLPAIRASKVSPMEAIREGFSQPKKKSLVKRLLVGLLTTSLGFTLLFGTIFDFFEVPGLSSLRQVGIGAAITFVGIAILAPSFSKPFISLFHYIYIFFFKILGKLSIENSKRTPRRTAATASALMIGLTLITLANVITTSFKAQSESLIKGVVLADYQISAAQVFVSPGVPAGLGEELLKLEEVTELGRVRATVAAFEDSPILLGGVDEAIFNLIKTKDISGDINKFREVNTLGVLKQKAERDNLSIGDSLTLYIPEEGEINFEIGYIFDWTTPPPAELFLLLDNYDFLKNETLDTEIYLNVKEKNDSTYNKIDNLVNEYPGVAFRDQDGLIEEANTQIQSLLNIIYGFLSISVFVALIGITNTLSLAVYERTREIGLMRAIGTLRTQIRRMIFLESSIISIFGAFLGTGLGILFAWSLIKSIEDQGFETFVVSTQQTLQWIGISIIAGILAAIIPAIRASRQNILQAISYE